MIIRDKGLHVSTRTLRKEIGAIHRGIGMFHGKIEITKRQLEILRAIGLDGSGPVRT
jgi:hypothetical protein